MRDVQGTMEWYKTHHTTSEIGFNPDGRCLQVCRTARDIAARYPSALVAALATPEEHRIYKIEDLRQGHVLYFDDQRDSNPFGHIVTLRGRVDGVDPSSPRSLRLSTNSVKSGLLVIVLGDYFYRHWGDPFMFGADWLNGVELSMPEQKQKPTKPLGPKGVERLREVIAELDSMIKHHKRLGHDRLVSALQRDKEHMLKTIERYKR